MDNAAAASPMNFNVQGTQPGVAALDARAVEEIGVARWLDSYAWPVSDAEFEELSNGAYTRFLELGWDLALPDQDLLFSDLGPTSVLIQSAHLNAARLRLSAVGAKPIATAITTPHLDPDWTAIARGIGPSNGAAARLQSSLRATAKTWVQNQAAPLRARIAATAGSSATWAIGSRSHLVAEYLGAKRLACTFVPPDRFLFSAAPGTVSASLTKAIGAYLDSFARHARQTLNLRIAGAPIAAAWHERLSRLSRYAAGIDRIRNLPKSVLVNELGQPTHRIIARSMSRRGVEAIGFHHGNDAGAQPYPSADITEMLCVDRFVLPSGTAEMWRRRHYEGGWLSGRRKVIFDHVKSPTYRKWLDKGQSAPPPSRIRDIMLVGFTFSWLRFPHMLAHWSLTQLDLELRLVRSLRAAGYRILYKAHPEWESTSRGILEGLVDEFVDGPFEQRWERADAFLFPRISSTTFGFALCTNRPVIVLDLAGQAWNLEAYALLARRCRMVPAYIDARNRVEFDAERLIAALRAPISKIDYEYVERAMCS